MLLTNHRKALKARAKSIYFENSVTLCFATLLFIALSVGFTILGNVYGSIFLNIAAEQTAILVMLTFELVGIIISFPLLFGYVSFCANISRKENASLSDVFDYYSRKEKLLSAAVCFLKLLRAIIFKIILPTISFVFLSTKLETFLVGSVGYLPDYVLYSFKGLFILPFILLFILCYYSFGNDIAKILLLNFTEVNGICVIYDKKRFLALRLSMLPLYLISFLSFGILFIVFTIPYTVVLYSLFFNEAAPQEELISLNEIEENKGKEEKTTVFDINVETKITDNIE